MTDIDLPNLFYDMEFNYLRKEPMASNEAVYWLKVQLILMSNVSQLPSG